MVMAKSIKCPKCGATGSDFFKLVRYIDFDNKARKVMKCLVCGTEFFADVDD